MKRINKADGTYNGIPIRPDAMYQIWLSQKHPELKRIDMDTGYEENLKQKFENLFRQKYPEQRSIKSKSAQDLAEDLKIRSRDKRYGGWATYPDEFAHYLDFLNEYKRNQRLNEIDRIDREIRGYIPTEEPTYAMNLLTRRVKPELTSTAYYQNKIQGGKAANISPLLSINHNRDYISSYQDNPLDVIPYRNINSNVFRTSTRNTKKSMKKKQQDYPGPMQPYVLPDMNNITWLSHMRNRPDEMYYTAYSMRDTNHQKKIPKDNVNSVSITSNARPRKNYNRQPLKFDFYLRYPDTVEGSNFTPQYNLYGEDRGGYMRNVQYPSSNTTTKRMSKRAIPTQRTDNNTNKYGI